MLTTKIRCAFRISHVYCGNVLCTVCTIVDLWRELNFNQKTSPLSARETVPVRELLMICVKRIQLFVMRDLSLLHSFLLLTHGTFFLIFNFCWKVIYTWKGEFLNEHTIGINKHIFLSRRLVSERFEVLERF